MGLILSDVDATPALPSSVSLEPVGDSMIIAGLNPPCLLSLSVHVSWTCPTTFHRMGPWVGEETRVFLKAQVGLKGDLHGSQDISMVMVREGIWDGTY